MKAKYSLMATLWPFLKQQFIDITRWFLVCIRLRKSIPDETLLALRALEQKINESDQQLKVSKERVERYRQENVILKINPTPDDNRKTDVKDNGADHQSIRMNWREDDDRHSSTTSVCSKNKEGRSQEMETNTSQSSCQRLKKLFLQDHDENQLKQFNLENYGIISMTLKNPLIEMKNQISSGFKMLLLLLVVLCLHPAKVNAQEGTVQTSNLISRIQGTVTDERGEALIGASVRIKESGKTTKTGLKGFFDLPATGTSAVIVVSYMGYKTQEVNLSNLKLPLNIKLPSLSVQMQEVVVSTGYQQIPLERATGSFVTVSNEQFNRQVSTDVISRLKAVAPSLLFDERSGSTKLSIRGRSTIFANDQPLIVLDNFPYDGDINNINPNDIENITILRDAGAASIWGARAGNGVIVITTRKGRENQPLTLELTSNMTVSDKPYLFYQPIASSSDFIDVEKLLFSRGYFDADLNNSTSRPPISPVVDILSRQKKGLLTPSEADAQINVLRTRDLRTDMEKYFYRSGIKQQHALNLRGGSSLYNYYFSAGYDDNLSPLVGNGYNRLSLNARQSFRPLKSLELNAAITYTQSKSQVNNTASELITGGPAGRVAYPYASLADEMGNHLSLIKDFNTSFKLASEAQGMLNWQYVPLDELSYSDNVIRLNDSRIQAGLKFKPFPELSAEINYQYQRQMSAGKDFRDPASYFVRNMINRYSSFSGATITRNIPAGGFLNRSNNMLVAHNGRAQLNYNKTLTTAHQIAVLAGTELREVNADGDRSRFYGYNPNLGSALPVDLLTAFPLYPSGFAQVPSEQGISGTTDRFRSYFANASYTYHDRYTLSTSGRIDQSNFFGLSRNQRAVPLWSAGIKWDLSKEIFYSLSWMPLLSIRATYGFNGNIDKSVTALTTANFTTNILTGMPAANINNPPNPNLGWEKTGILNIGVDLNSKNNRVRASIDYYQKTGLDLIGLSPLDPTAGLTTYRGNVAAMKGRGVDVQLNILNLDKKIRWETNFLFSYTTDKITKYNVAPVFAGYMADASLSGSTSSFSPTVGRPLFGIYSRRWAGLDPLTGDPLGYINGKPSSNYASLNSSAGKTVDSLVYHGRALPPVYGAFRNTFTYKGWSISGNISYRFGYYFKRTSIEYSSFFNTGTSHSDYALRWQKPGDEQFTHVPSIPAVNNDARDNFYKNSEILVERGDNIRLQDISVSYSLDKLHFKKLPFRDVKVYMNVNNPGIIWSANKLGIDPDFPQMPLPMNFSVGLKTTL